MIIPEHYEFIKHKRFMDVCCQVVSFNKYSPNYYTVKIRWYDMAFEKSYYIGYNKTIKIKDRDLKDWQIALDSVDCLRNSRWKDLV